MSLTWTPTLDRALAVAARCHAGQTRKDEPTPYIAHPVAVALIVSDFTDDEDVAVAALLHDVLEDVPPSVYSAADMTADFGERVRKYWVVSTLFGLIVAVIDSIALMILDVPLPLTFGLLAFVTNYIPNIGFVIGLVPPALLALLDGGVEKMIWVVVIYSVANFVIQTVLQPKFTGDAVGINATTAFLSLMFWTYVFGALGALLAIPFTLLFKSLLIDRDPAARWINQFIASSPDERRSAQPL